MIIIKNLKIFTVNVNCKYHWSNLPKFINKMKTNKIKLPFRANLQEADFRGADFQGADLQGADFQGANLQRTNLQGANLQGANLQGANFRGADLQGADFRGADFREANFQGAYLRGAKSKIEILDFMSVSRIGSFDRTTLFFKTEKGIFVQCGCFYGSEKEFKESIAKTHGANQYAKEYNATLRLVNIRFKR